jgi:hypothetical protein
MKNITKKGINQIAKGEGSQGRGLPIGLSMKGKGRGLMIFFKASVLKKRRGIREKFLRLGYIRAMGLEGRGGMARSSRTRHSFAVTP